MKKKTVMLLLSGMVVASMLVGCGSEGKTSEESKDTVATESTAETDEADEEEDSSEEETTEADTAEDADEEDAVDEGTDAAEDDAADEDADTEDTTEADADEEDTTDTADAKTSDTASTFNADTVSVAGWNLTVEDVQENPSLENVSVEMGYTNVETTSFKKEADTGKTFCLIKMKIEKDGSKESIDWANMKVTDSDGNEYERMDDEFLTELGMMRMPGNTLNFGTSEGWIVYEVNEDAEGLELNYSFDSEEYNCTL